MSTAVTKNKKLFRLKLVGFCKSLFVLLKGKGPGCSTLPQLGHRLCPCRESGMTDGLGVLLGYI